MLKGWKMKPGLFRWHVSRKMQCEIRSPKSVDSRLALMLKTWFYFSAIGLWDSPPDHLIIRKLTGFQVENDSRDISPSYSILSCMTQIVIRTFILHATEICFPLERQEAWFTTATDNTSCVENRGRVNQRSTNISQASSTAELSGNMWELCVI